MQITQIRVEELENYLEVAFEETKQELEETWHTYTVKDFHEMQQLWDLWIEAKLMMEIDPEDTVRREYITEFKAKYLHYLDGLIARKSAH
ncbi:hypothetical protein ACU3L3_07105 [Priestia endophytica]|jgi:hypothetical protein